MMKFYDKDKRKSDLTALANALSKRDTTPINTGNISPVQTRQQEGKDVLSGASDLLGGGMQLYKGLQGSGLFGGGANTDGLSLGNYFGSGSSGSMTFDNIMGNGGSGSMTFDNIGSGSGGGGFGYIGLANGLMNGLNQGFNSDDKIMGGFGNGLQGMFGVDSENDSEIMQGIKGTVNGASTGASVGGPWGALIGGILGLSSSFLDDF